MIIASKYSKKKLVDWHKHDAYHGFLLYFKHFRRTKEVNRLNPCVAQRSGVVCQEI